MHNRTARMHIRLLPELKAVYKAVLARKGISVSNALHTAILDTITKEGTETELRACGMWAVVSSLREYQKLSVTKKLLPKNGSGSDEA